jgi:hypothetical protein
MSFISEETLAKINLAEVTCNDGTKDILNGKAPACLNHGGIKGNVAQSTNMPYKPLQSKEDVNKRMEEEIAKIKFPLKTTLMTSAVPLGLAYFSYNQKYSLTKGIGVIVIGSAVAFFGAIMFSKGKFV